MKKLISTFVMTCMLVSISAFMMLGVSAAPSKTQAKWTDSFAAQYGDITIDQDSATVTMKSEQSTKVPALYWNGAKISNDFFDIEWDMTMKKATNGINVQVRTGSKRIYLDFTQSGIQPMGAARINVSLGINISHNYRLIYEDGVGEIYVDDEFVSNFVLSDNTVQRGFGFYANGSYGDTEVDITNAVIHEQDNSIDTPVNTVPSVQYVPNYNYMQEFDDPSVVQGERWKNTYEAGIKIEDGLLKANCDGGGGFIRHWFGTPSNFTAETKLRIEYTGDTINYIITWPSHRVTMKFIHDDISVNNKTLQGVNIRDGEWHIIKTIGYNDGQSAVIYIDDNLVWAGSPSADNPAVANESQWHFNFNANHNTSADKCVAEVDYIHVVGNDTSNSPTLSMPMDNAAYLRGENIPLKATVPENSTATKVNFTLNGNVIATAEAPDFTTSIDNLLPGTYKVAAETEDGTARSPMHTITVKASVQTELQISDNDAGMNIKTKLFDRYNDVKLVEYFVDGVSVGKSSAAPDFSIQANNISPSAHTVVVKAYDQNGMTLSSDSVPYINNVNTDNATNNYMNELSYTVSGDSGNAVYSFSNGIHKVQLNHTVDQVTYLTDTGEKTFNLGTGDFKILTDGATADVYRNGQMAFSYYLPMTNECGREIQENGMHINNVNTSIPDNMMTYYQDRDITGHGIVSYFEDLPYYNNMDFVADKNDNFRVILCDGYYRMDVELKDGKFYVRKTDKDNSEPYTEEVCSAKDGEAYYRVETAAGAVRLYGNGRWMTTFRGEHAEGDRFLAIDAENPVKYISVHDNHDLYLYEDDFSGRGENDSLDFWMNANTEPYIAEGNDMVVNGLGTTDAIAELSAYVGDFDLSADVQVAKDKGGVYFLLNRSVTSIYSKIGYNFDTKQYELVDRSGSNYTIKKAVDGEFPSGEKVQMRLRVFDTPDGKTATLYVNGNEVLQCENGLVMGVRGRCGILVDNNVANVSYVSYRGDAYVNIGMHDTIINVPNTDVLEIGDQIILSNGGTRAITTDGGKTWRMDAAPSFESFNLLQLRDKDGNPNGKILSMINKQVGVNEEGKALRSVFCAMSTDGGESYEEISRVTPEGHTVCGAMPNRVTQGPSGRVYFTDCVEQNESGGITDIYYSDDEGMTWTKSETQIGYYNTGSVIAENIVVEMGNGVTRLYSRTDLGQLIYFESYDYGKTWSLTKHETPFLTATNCYNIQVDPYNPDHIYVAWGYDNANLHPVIQQPRTRFGVAMSPDNGETWNYVGTAHENNGVDNAMMNLSINVTKDYLIIGQGIHTDSHSYVKNGDGARNVFIPKANIKPLMDFEQVHMRWNWISNVRTISESSMINMLVVNPTDGNVLLRGKELIENAAYDNMIALDCFAYYLGGTIDTVDGATVLKTGNKTLSIPADRLSDMNGRKFVDLDYIVEVCGLKVSEYEDIKVYDEFGILTSDSATLYRAMTQLFYDNAAEAE